MVHIEIILYTVYCIVFSTACFLVLKKLYNKKLEELEKKYKEDSENMECKFKKLHIKQDEIFLSAKHEVVKENNLYLSRMNKDISTRIKELASIVKNRPII
jgi:beta-lactamase regulating signal transducer with metallopeptidase domain|tara:strand:- start:1930 stop:2232 length:303 start_codon:yes stop_codon:yes gene_type:complete